MPDCAAAHRGHEGVENTDSEGGAACEWLGEVELSVGVIVIILDQSEMSIIYSLGPITAHLVQELDIAVIHQLSNHWNI